MTFRNIITIGASAGGIETINQLISKLGNDFEAPILCVLHLSQRSSAENIISFFKKSTSMSCMVASDGMKLEKGNFYMAPENVHMLVSDGIVTINNGPREHRYRPSIDSLFRSVAVNYGSRAVGVILSGMLDDGTSGMQAIKRCGGICIIQEPTEAEYHQMPSSVLNRVEVDYRASINDIPGILKDVLQKPLPPEIPVPEELRTEFEITEKMMSSINQLKKIADKSDISCPDCGGGLWEIKNDPSHRYRCYTGHTYTEKALYDIHSIHLEESLWVSIRMLEERRNIIESLARHSEGRIPSGLTTTENKERIQELEKHIHGLKYILRKMMEHH